MIKLSQFRELIVKPTLERLTLYSEDAMELLVFTCALESAGGSYIKNDKIKGLGIYNMDAETYNDLWQNTITKDTSLMLRMSTNFDIRHFPDEDRLIYDLRYATAITMIYYHTASKILPHHTNINELWDFYKLYYNFVLEEEYKLNYIAKYHGWQHT